ncbi:MAG TPA: PepSY domain-containing protein [Candidatus Nitrosocosmicus sp.]|nr:PepSY domain-containing protein [Candidatus Nitrosocosmicus sp.]
MFNKKNIEKTYKHKIVTSIILLTIMLVGISIVEDRHIAFAQVNNTQNTQGNLNIEEESASNQTDLKSAAKITNDEAIQIALKNVSGQPSDVKGVELENENGNIVYSVNVVQGNESKDVKVGAVDGNILEVENGDLEGEDNSDDANEEGDDVGDDDTAEYENNANKSNSTEIIQKFQ